MNYYNIKSCLRYGKVPSKSEFRLLWVFFSILLLFPLYSLSIIVTILLGVMSWDSDVAMVLLTSTQMFCCLMAIDIYMIHFYKKLYKELTLWLEDAVEASAFVRRMDVLSVKYKPYQVEFQFCIEGKEYRRLSSHGGLIVGQNKTFIKYNNSFVKIMYSPKYDQVMVLRD